MLKHKPVNDKLILSFCFNFFDSFHGFSWTNKTQTTADVKMPFNRHEPVKQSHVTTHILPQYFKAAATFMKIT